MMPRAKQAQHQRVRQRLLLAAGRAVVGGVLTGGLGAVAGAATAKKNTSDNATSQTITKHKYTLYINVNSLQEPTISLRIGDNVAKAQKLAGIINVIIERNKN